jgi:hypothetical protein
MAVASRLTTKLLPSNPSKQLTLWFAPTQRRPRLSWKIVPALGGEFGIAHKRKLLAERRWHKRQGGANKALMTHNHNYLCAK